MRKRNSRILDEAYETARGLHRPGLISKRRMSEFEALGTVSVAAHTKVYQLSGVT